MKTPTLTEYGTYEYREEGDETNSSQAAPIPHIPKDEDSLPKEVNPNNPFAAGKTLYDDAEIEYFAGAPKSAAALEEQQIEKLKANRNEKAKMMNDVFQKGSLDIPRASVSKMNETFKESLPKRTIKTDAGENEFTSIDTVLNAVAYLVDNFKSFTFHDLRMMLFNGGQQLDPNDFKKFFEDWIAYMTKMGKIETMNGCYNEPVYRWL